jgi:CheY-like chemotaxis protein
MMNTGWEGSMPRILIVEDDKIIASLLEQILTNQGFSIAGIASSGEQAIELALRSHVDLVLTNINLKGSIDGTIAAQVVGAFLKIPVIFVSARHQSEYIDKIKGAYPVSFITKPFAPEELYANIVLATSFRSAVNKALDVDLARINLLVNIAITKRSVAGLMTPNGKLLYASGMSQRALFKGEPIYGEYAFQDVIFYDSSSNRQITSPLADIFNEAQVLGINKSCTIQFATGKPKVCNVVVEGITDIAGSVVALLFDIVPINGEI